MERFYKIYNELRHSLTYACTEDEIKKFEDEYNKALIDCDIMMLDKIVGNAQQKILQKWVGATTNVDDYKLGEPFRFLCHSVDGYNWYGSFRSKYVSCSLICDKYMNVLHYEYGFILPSKNIVAASDKDLNTNNRALDDNHLFESQNIEIKTPDEIIELCLKRKEVKSEDTRWNEIVEEGFNPEAIFCLTDGSKELDPDYIGAYNLKEHFPKLKVVEIDKTLYLPEEKQLELLDRLIHQINLCKRCDGTLKGLFSSCLFKKFWYEFMELKKSGNYTTEDILDLYDKNVEELLNDDLTSTFLDPWLYSCLNYISDCFFNSLTFGDVFISDSLNGLYDRLKNYANDPRLDEYIPGLSTFLMLYKDISNLPEEYLRELRYTKSFKEVNIILKNYLDSLNNRDVQGDNSPRSLAYTK